MTVKFNIIGYILFILVASITPGPNNILLFAMGKKYGLAKSIPVIIGIVLGFTILLCLSGYGISILITSNKIAAFVLKVISSLWLLYLAYRMSKIHNFDNKNDSPIITLWQALIMQYSEAEFRSNI